MFSAWCVETCWRVLKDVTGRSGILMAMMMVMTTRVGFSRKSIRACDYSSTNWAYVAMTVTAMCGLLVVLVLARKGKKLEGIRTVHVQLNRMFSRHQTSI